ncbi:aldehyde dehydrogenase family protein [Tardiphaga sp. 215_C5_N2_1]|uniref:aldehyde dehydrogenase family protein n=1 Tax=Tardiphaga sp. 215_C5_N2_1 TaxID=3240774 RepID=UPI003F88FCE5
MTYRFDHFIAGASSTPASGKYLPKMEPATGKPLAQVAAGDKSDVDKAVQSAYTAWPAWRDRRPIERGRILLKIAEKIRERINEIATIEARETGKPLVQALREVEGAAQYFEFYGGLVNVMHGEVIDIGAAYHSYTRREPYGVVGVITPWNAPINQGGRGIAPALAVGNVVVAKPSEETSGSLLEVARLAVDECGLPPGVLNVVLGAGQEAGKSLVEHPLVRKVAFTGSVRAGREIGRIAAERIIPLTLELGGKSPNIVFEDADLSLAVPGSVRAFTANAGQICLAGTRCLVQESIHDAFVERVTRAVKAIKVGADKDATMGPLTTKPQFEKVQEYFNVAKSEGAKLEIGGQKLANDESTAGWFVEPTVYSGVTNDMRIAREEIFGPVLAIIPFTDDEDAIRLANDTEYGLAAGIWTRDLSRGLRVAARLEAGQIYVNEYQAGGVETPLGGYKGSGYGREKGVEALHHYTQLKCVTIKL